MQTAKVWAYVNGLVVANKEFNFTGEKNMLKKLLLFACETNKTMRRDNMMLRVRFEEDTFEGGAESEYKWSTKPGLFGSLTMISTKSIPGPEV